MGQEEEAKNAPQCLIWETKWIMCHLLILEIKGAGEDPGLWKSYEQLMGSVWSFYV